MAIIKRALISVSDKAGIIKFAKALSNLGVEILSTGGTAKLFRDSNIPVIEVSDYTGFPEMLDGRVKTLHPKVHGGILGRRDLPEHVAAMQAQSIPNIDMVVVNLYPFEATVAKPNCMLEDAIENIDIGGPAMVRSAAKNWKDVAVLTDASQYANVLAELQACGSVSTKTKPAVNCFEWLIGNPSNVKSARLGNPEEIGTPHGRAIPLKMQVLTIKSAISKGFLGGNHKSA